MREVIRSLEKEEELLRIKQEKEGNSLMNKKVGKYFGFLVMIILFYGFLAITFTPSSSMEPTFKTGGLQFRKCCNVDKMERGDPVEFRIVYEKASRNGIGYLFQKRIIGLPGERITINDKGVFINGKLLKEDYIAKDTSYKNYNIDIVIPEDSYFVMGDNRNDSLDARYLPFCYVRKDWVLPYTTYAIFNTDDGLKAVNKNYILGGEKNAQN